MSADSISPLLRGATAHLPIVGDSSWRRPAFTLINPQLFFVHNSALPTTSNYGGLWGGRGVNARVLAGVRLDWGRLRLVVAPQLLYSANDSFALVPPPFFAPPTAGFSEWASPWNVSRRWASPYLIDTPVRFGPEARAANDPGESGVWYIGRRLEGGITTEHHWWGPGIRNAMILSNNARGFLHSMVRTRAPMATPIGHIDGQWLVGSVLESPFFDANSFNNRNSITALAVTLRPRWEPELAMGIARVVYMPMDQAKSNWRRPFDVFRNIGRPNSRPAADTTLTPSPDQLLSMFFRWQSAADSFAIHAEIGRAELPVSVRDFLAEPTHSLAFTAGAEQAYAVRNGLLRLQLEVTQLERAATRLHRPSPSWYTSRAVVQGYTHRGLVLGAASGPGSSSQWLALDFFRPNWTAGALLSRIRFNTDAHFTIPFEEGQGWCEYDVAWSPGFRAARSFQAIGEVSASAMLSRRFNVFFQHVSGCPAGQVRRDERNLTLTMAVTPLVRW